MAVGVPVTPAGRRLRSGIARPRSPWPAEAARAFRKTGAVVRELAGTVVAGLDALLVGLVVAFVLAAALNGPAAYLGIPWPLEMLVTGGGALVVALLGAAAGTGIAWLVRLLGRGVDLALRRAPLLSRAPARMRRVASLPFRVVTGLPAAWLGAFGAVLALAILGSRTGPLGLFLPPLAMTPYIFIIGGAFAVVGAGTYVVRPALPRPRRMRRGAAALLASVAILGTAGGTAVLLSPGGTDALVATSTVLDGSPRPQDLADPGQPGVFSIRELSYGSGTDLRRPAFGPGVALTTPPVDASRVLPALGSGADEARRWFWGFGTDALPLNGLAWVPEGEGPFPIVLMVHGNHAMGDFSEPGYGYLGRHLASRGFIAVSVDENFLNGSWADDWDGAEQVVRAWLLLLHLDAWRTWNEQPGSPVAGRVDMDRVALIGHSRGGEAASLAASLATRSTAPDFNLVPWPTGLRVSAVVAIAPSDGQYPSPIVLRDVDLLELQGGHDSDVRGWIGLQQYARTTVTGNKFKAALWAYRANHGQFNTAWGRSDWGPFGGAQLNLAPILEPAAQEDVAKTAIGAFLEASLNDIDGYRGLFQRPMTGREWLPDDIFLVRSVGGDLEPLTLGDPLQPVGGVTVTLDGLELHRAATIPLRAIQPSQGIRGLELRWAGGGGEAAWGLAGLGDQLAGVADPVLHVSLANGAEPTDDASILDPMVEVTTADAVTVALPLSQWGALPPPLTVQLSKSPLIDALGGIDLTVNASVEHVLQSYAIRLSEFATANPAFRVDRVTSFRIAFDRSSTGGAWVAEVGLADGG